MPGYSFLFLFTLLGKSSLASLLSAATPFFFDQNEEIRNWQFVYRNACQIICDVGIGFLPMMFIWGN